ncbi:AgmX/PglI C-terminal domain-containing protein [Myxococcota bacterium]|nr:AgmX/PglI C-terminal domain-containing protein [Myxococcota bacterium]
MGVELTLQVIKEGQVVGTHNFDSDSQRTIKIGRLGSAQVKLDDPKAARIHAVIEFASGAMSLIDMGSKTGTHVNDSRVHKTTLAFGDKIKIGDTEIQVCEPGSVAVQPEPVAAPVPGMMPAGAAPVPGMMPAGAAPVPGMMPAGAAPVPGMPSPNIRPAGGVTTPRFDQGAGIQPVRRMTQEGLRSAAVENKPHPSIRPEEAVTEENRFVELRYYWGEALLNIFHYHHPKKLTIGESKQADIFLTSEGLPVEIFPLIRSIDGEYVLTFSDKMEGELNLSGSIFTLKEVRATSYARKDDKYANCYQVRLKTDARALIHWGGATFAIRFVSPPRALPSKPFDAVDLPIVNAFIGSIFFHIAAIITFMVYPYDTSSLKEDLFDKPDRFASLVLEAPKPTESTEDLLKKIKEKVEKKKEKIEEEKPKPTKQLLTKTPIKKIKKPKKTKDQKAAEMKQKLSKFLSGGSGSGAGSLLGGGGGGTLSGTLTNVIGSAGAGSATAGMAGLGIRGGAALGGGMGTSRGLGGIGTSGRSGGGGLGYGSGVGLKGRKSRSVMGLGTPVVMGSLPKDVIQKVINKNKNQIRYCYEVQLQRNQNLEGKISVKWIISATGSVSKTSLNSSTMKNRAVERCILAKIKTWKFPAPAGGGIVEVNYPFVFKAS